MTDDLQPQVIVLDVHMPDGHSITPAAFKSRIAHDLSRVLAISVWNDEEIGVLEESFGAAKLLSKVNLGTQLVLAIAELASPAAGAH